jgi:hypothetical protein
MEEVEMKGTIKSKVITVSLSIDLEKEEARSSITEIIDRRAMGLNDKVDREWVKSGYSIKSCDLVGGSLLVAKIEIAMVNKLKLKEDP